MALALKNRSVLPGFGMSLGINILGLSVLVLLPFIMLVFTTVGIGWQGFFNTIADPRVLSAIWVSLRLSFIATMVNLVFGTLLAWVLIRYKFPGRSFINALVDLPFALPTAVTGIALASLYAPNGLIGQFFTADGFIGKVIGDTPIAFTSKGVCLALIVVSLPFIVRTVQPVLENLNKEREEAGAVLGASRFQVIKRVIVPELLPALLMGAGMMFARATGEYGSVIFIANNIPFDTEILPLVIIGKLDQFDIQGAAAVALFMLLISLVILLTVNIIQWRYQRRLG